MGSRDRAWTREHQAAALQLIVELDRGLNIAQQQLKLGRFTDARTTLDADRALLPTLEQLIQHRPLTTHEQGANNG